MSAIASLNDYQAVKKQRVVISKTTTSSTNIVSAWAAGGNPGAGSLSVGNTANGLVPDNTTTGAAALQTFNNPGRFTKLEAQHSSANWGRYVVYDRLFHAGSYAFNASTSLSSQPSYSGRLPTVSGNPDYTGLQIWVECATAMTGALSVAVTYTDQDGNGAHTTGTISVGALTVGQMVQLPLAAGDVGVRKIESVTGTVASAGTFNILVVRPLAEIKCRAVTKARMLGLEELRLGDVFNNSCLAMYHKLVTAAAQLVDIRLELSGT